MVRDQNTIDHVASRLTIDRAFTGSTPRFPLSQPCQNPDSISASENLWGCLASYLVEMPWKRDIIMVIIEQCTIPASHAGVGARSFQTSCGVCAREESINFAQSRGLQPCKASLSISPLKLDAIQQHGAPCRSSYGSLIGEILRQAWLQDRDSAPKLAHHD